MKDEAELRAAMETAFLHTRPGGAAIFAPDCLQETFREVSFLHGAQSGSRALRCLEWSWDPDPTDSRYTVEYGLLLREGMQVELVHDRHEEGLFSRAPWLGLLESVGFRPEVVGRTVGPEEGSDTYTSEILLARRPS